MLYERELLMILFYSGICLVFLELLQSSTNVPLFGKMTILSGYLHCWDCNKDLGAQHFKKVYPNRNFTWHPVSHCDAFHKEGKINQIDITTINCYSSFCL